jgi:hypothetical protein
MYTDLENSPPQYRAICGILACLDLTQPDSPVTIKPETQALLDGFSEADWDLFARMAKAEGVAPLMYHAITRSAFQAPEATRLKLQTAYYETAAFNQVILTEMERVAQALNDAGIPVIVLKGAALAWTVYPDPALRPMNDLDLLVKTEDLERAKELVLSLGYHEPIPEMARGFNRMAGYHNQLNKNDNHSIKVELHWSLVAGENDARSPNSKWFWSNLSWIENPKKSNSSTSKFQTLSIEAHLLYLTGHLILQHGKAASRIIWFYDILEFIQYWEKVINWQYLINEADRMGYIPVLRFALQKINSDFKMDLPVGLIPKGKKIANHTNELLVNLLWKGDSGRLINALSQLIAMKGWKKFQLLMGYFFPDATYMQWRYHYRYRWQRILYYPVRWYEIVIKGMRTLAERW